MATLNFKSEEEDGRAYIALTGELDISSMDMVDEELRRLEANRPHVGIVDLRELTFLDSTGLKALAQANQRADEEQRRLVIVRGPERVQLILQWTGFEQSLDIVDDPAAV